MIDKYYIIAGSFLLLSMLLGIGLIIFIVLSLPKVFTSCNSNVDCMAGQICKEGVCNGVICENDSDCKWGNLCIAPYCYYKTCKHECSGTGMACVKGRCVKIGQVCYDKQECTNGLTCDRNTCVQCTSAGDCPTGMTCSNEKICRSPSSIEVAPDAITFASFAQINGNISAPPAYFCNNTSCGSEPILCTGTCPHSCPYCINGVCRCTPGEIYEPCNNNDDCISHNCQLTDYGMICLSRDAECAFNYGQGGSIKSCPSTKPYCSNGICSTQSRGSLCSTSDSCINLGDVTSSNGWYCVNGTCQDIPGITSHL